MENWVPLFTIFLNSYTPESEASRWFHDSFNASSSPTTTTTTTTNSFISLLNRPAEESALPSNSTRAVIWMETLPTIVQSRILSFLAYEHQRFSTRDLAELAKTLLSSDKEVDYWVEIGARNLLGKLSQSEEDLNSGSNMMTSSCRLINEEFYSLPTWLKGSDGGGADYGSGLVLPWLPLPVNELKLDTTTFCTCSDGHESLVETSHDDPDSTTDDNKKGYVNPRSPDSYSLDAEIQNTVKNLNDRLLKLQVASEIADLANEISHLCLNKKRSRRDSLAILEVIEPWKADDEIVAVLLPHLLGDVDEDDKYGNNDDHEEEDGWPSQVLCSTILPKLLFLAEPASRVLTNLIIDYCKHYQRAAEYALLLPLILRKEAITTHIADVMIGIVKDCLHPAHIGAFCQKLLCAATAAADCRRRFMCLPCHQSLISPDELVWSEPVFSLFQNILNKNVHLTQDSVDCLVYKVNQLAGDFSRSLKFGNFLLSFVIKCFPQLKHHKVVLIEAASRTTTLVTRAILVKVSLL